MGTCASSPVETSALKKSLDDTLASKHSTVHEEVVRETSHPILRAIETIQTESAKPFGRILDAGTGLGSFNWLAHLLWRKDEFGVNADDWIAVRASDVMATVVTKEAKRIGIDDPEKHLILGNWFEEEGEEPLLQGEMFDTILIDYLIGT